MQKLKDNYAAIVATVALVVALTGTGAMASGVLVTSKQIKNGSILTQDIRKNAVTDKSIGTNAVTSTDIKDDAVGAEDIGAGQVDSEAIGTGQVSSSDIGNGQVTPQDVTMPEPKQLQESDTASAEVGTEFSKIDDIGTYSKDDPSSVLEIDWSGTAESGAGTACVFQIRVDEQPSGPAAGLVFLGIGSASSVAVTALFSGLGAGPHAIEIWARETAGPGLTNCIVGPSKAGGVPQTFVLSEQVF